MLIPAFLAPSLMPGPREGLGKDGREEKGTGIFSENNDLTCESPSSNVQVLRCQHLRRVIDRSN